MSILTTVVHCPTSVGYSHDDQSQASNKSRGISDDVIGQWSHGIIVYVFKHGDHQSFVKDDSKTVECVNKQKIECENMDCHNRSGIDRPSVPT